MKKITVFLALLSIVAVFLFDSCKKEDLPSMNASFDGTSKNFLFRTSTRGSIPSVGEGFMIIGTTGADVTDGEYLTLLIRGVDVRAYNLSTTIIEGKFECEAIYRPGGEGDTTLGVYYGKDGSISITKIDEENKKVSGSFSFTLYNKLVATDVISITNGKFENLKYINASIVTDDFEL